MILLILVWWFHSKTTQLTNWLAIYFGRGLVNNVVVKKIYNTCFPHYLKRNLIHFFMLNSSKIEGLSISAWCITKFTSSNGKPSRLYSTALIKRPPPITFLLPRFLRCINLILFLSIVGLSLSISLFKNQNWQLR